jgi:predicted transcriptional regulator
MGDREPKYNKEFWTLRQQAMRVAKTIRCLQFLGVVKTSLQCFAPTKILRLAGLLCRRFVPARKGNSEVCHVIVSSNDIVYCSCGRHSHRLALKTESADTYGALTKRDV